MLVMPKSFLMACLTTVPVIIASIMLDHLYPSNQLSVGVFVIGLLAFGLGSVKWIPFIYARMPCPTCNQSNLQEERSKDTEKWHLLVCKNCGVEWLIGIGDNTD